MHIVLTENCTADGVIDMSAGWFDPTDHSDPELVEATRGHMAEQDRLLLGRVTFEAFRGFWPHQTDDTSGISEHLDRINKYVLSTTMDDPEWERTTILRDLDAVHALAGTIDRLSVTGSISVAHQLVDADLVDEYRLFVHPVVVGAGAGVARKDQRLDLALVEARAFPSGVTLLRYERQESPASRSEPTRPG